MENNFILGIDVGGTKIAAALVDSKGHIIEEAKETTCCEDLSSFLLPLCKVIDDLLEFSANKKFKIGGIGLAIAGFIDFRKQTVIFAPNLPLKEVPIKDILEERFNTLTFIDNDANCAAWGEKLFGAGRDAENLICVTLGTGIGGGIILGGRLYRGAVGGAGEIGHMVIDLQGQHCGCGSFGCFEALASAQALVRRTISEAPSDSLILEFVKGERQKISGETITEAARKGDIFAQTILADIGRIIGTGLANLINIFDPEVIVVGGGLAEASEFILPLAREQVLSQVMAADFRQIKIVPGKLGQKAGIIGAAMLARDELSS
jgi:glucokinase